MISRNSRCQILKFSESHIKSALPLFTDEKVREYLGGPLPADWAEKRLEHWAKDESENMYFAVTLHDGSFVGFIDISPYHDPTMQYIPETALYQELSLEETLKMILSDLGVHHE